MAPPPSAIDVEAVTDTTGVTIPDPLSAPIESNEILGRRRKANKSQWGTAAPADSANFRQRNHENKPKAKRWDHYISHEARIRKGNSLKQAAKYLGKPGLISLGGGLPSSEYFPFESISLKLPAVGHFSEAETRESGVTVTAGKHDLADDKSIFDISTAFNYGQGSGAAQLLRWITEHTELVHDPPYSDWRCTMTIGSTSALDMALRMLSRPGDMMLTETYTFSAAVETAAPLGVRMLGVPMDEQGLLPAALDHLLTTWDASARSARKPHLLYTVPTGQNPTGATQSAPRRRALYAVCQKHDLFILEDEPYYFLQMQPYTGSKNNNNDTPDPPPPPPSSHAAFLRSLVPSYLSLDTDGRVLRMDSFSKVLSPGSRCGWITAPSQIIATYQRHADVSTQCPSGIAQLVLFKLLDEHWGHAGYLDWLLHLRHEYTARRNTILAACEKYLPREVVSWRPPMAGMFHWMRVDCTRHRGFVEGRVGRGELEEAVFLQAIERGALVMRGSWFLAEAEGGGEGGQAGSGERGDGSSGGGGQAGGDDGRVGNGGREHEDQPALFFRATYAAAPAEKIEEGIRRFGEALREEFGLSSGNGAG